LAVGRANEEVRREKRRAALRYMVKEECVYRRGPGVMKVGRRMVVVIKRWRDVNENSTAVDGKGSEKRNETRKRWRKMLRQVITNRKK
jgi:hypothetical protein